MPWIDEKLCTRCGICIDECCADAISMKDDSAFVDEELCIRCGVCHDVCPSEAVRHDGELIPSEVNANIEWVEYLLSHEYYRNHNDRKREVLERLKRYFNKQKKVADLTIERLQKLSLQ